MKIEKANLKHRCLIFCTKKKTLAEAEARKLIQHGKTTGEFLSNPVRNIKLVILDTQGYKEDRTLCYSSSNLMKTRRCNLYFASFKGLNNKT